MAASNRCQAKGHVGEKQEYNNKNRNEGLASKSQRWSSQALQTCNLTCLSQNTKFLKESEMHSFFLVCSGQSEQ